MASRIINPVKRLFVIVNKPVECKIPYFVSVQEADSLLEDLYAKQSEGRPHLSKKELEKLCIMPMTGPRYSLLKVEVPLEWFDPKKLT
jgi:hypothetical protein